MLAQRRQPLLRIVAGCLDDLYAALDDGPHVAGIVRWSHGGQERQVHAERLVRHLAAPRDLFGEVRGRALRQSCDDAKPARIRNRGRHLGKADIVHAALKDRMLDAEHLCNAGLHMLVLQGK